MEQTLKEHLIKLLKTEVVPALGCTEPIAVALAVAKAREVLGSLPTSITVYVSPNILKNGMGVGVPGTGMVGLHIAAALGVFYGDTSSMLQLLNGVTPDAVHLAKQFVEGKKVTIAVKSDIDKLYVEAICRNETDSASVFIKGAHSNIVLVERNGAVMNGSAEALKPTSINPNELSTCPKFLFSDIYEFATTTSMNEIEFILEGGVMNKRISDEGLRGDYGLKVGKCIIGKIDKNILKDDLLTYAMAVTSAASDARMAGNELPAMSNSGSGNQGITVMLPVVAVSEKLKSSTDELARALVISNLLSIYIKSKMGRLSALCGVAVAATASSCGIVFLLGGTFEQMTYAIRNMVGNLTGMICDGAKVGCSLKVSSGVSASVNAALLAIDNICIQETDGIVTDDVESTIENLAKLGSEGMVETDKMILDLMLKK